ncbi:hypothetical protein TNCV_1922341, partial [Trichonephila clavipes]
MSETEKAQMAEIRAARGRKGIFDQA